MTGIPELRNDKNGLVLVSGSMELRVDLIHMIPRLRPDRLARELLVRAAKVRGVRHPFVIDATAGLGEDALLLAAAGFEVTLYERNPIVAALLMDALHRGTEVPRLAEVITHMHAFQNDSILVFSRLAAQAAQDVQLDLPDVIYLDPMFPERAKSAEVKKKFQLLHMLASPCADEPALLEAALGVHPRKVVIKRPLRAPAFAGLKPSYTVVGKTIRYDVIVLSR